MSSHFVNFFHEDKFSTRENSTTPPQSPSKKLRLISKSIVDNFIHPSVFIFQRFFIYLICLFISCLCIALILIAIPLIYSCFLIVALATLPLLLISLLIIRIFQFIKYGNGYKKLTYFKHFIRGWLYINVMMVLLGLWIFYPIAKYAPSLKQVMLLDLPFTKWVVIISIACGFYLISYLIYSLTHRLTLFLNVRSLNVAQAFSEIIDSLIFWWAEHEVIKRVPTFKNHEVLGVLTRKWIRVSVLLLIGYNLITLFTHIFVVTLRKICQQRPKVAHQGGFWQKLIGEHLHKKYVVYFADGMKWSINFIMSSLLLLLVWVLYFGSRIDMTSAKARHIWEFGVWTCLSLLICSFLWLIKTFVLLAWEVHTIYHRLEPRILHISEQLYFLGILGRYKHDILKLRHKFDEDHEQATLVRRNRGKILDFIYQSMSSLFKSPSKNKEKFVSISGETINKLIIRRWERVKNALLIQKDPTTVDDLRRATRYFLMAKRDLMKETYIFDILSNFDPTTNNWETMKKLISGNDHHEELNLQGKLLMKIFTINSTNRRSHFEGEIKEAEQGGEPQTSNSSDIKQSNDWDHFVREFPSINQGDSFDICYTNIQTWVQRAHKQCMFLANTLSSADEVGRCLNNIISWLLIGATFMMWLLLTGLATTRVLVLIASPLLAATFIFGNACKTLFEGILFVYVVHPLDVGDLCVIDNIMMEVTAIGIWTTTFTKVDKLSTDQEVVIHPNLELANKVIINHKTKFDWRDCIEYDLGNLNSTNINNQKETIKFFKDHLEQERFYFLSSSRNLTISVMEDDSIKLVIRLEYNAEGTKGCTYSECLRRKDELKADFCLLMHDVINQFKGEKNIVNK